jgi:biotin-dependent carboxylase-like uncharacterized protein
MKDTFLVMSPGPCTTVQDLGRFGYQHLGMPACGALDGFAMRVANLLLGNPEECAVLEMTVIGAQLAVLRETDIALTGADMEIKLNSMPVGFWQSMRLKPGDLLSIQTVKSGCRGYLAATGGIHVPIIMGSRSTHINGKVGGFEGRPLQKGDIVRQGQGELLNRPRDLPVGWIPRHQDQAILRAVPGPQDNHFREALTTFFTAEYTLSAASDRMGCRLIGPELTLEAGAQPGIVSEPTMPGSVQVPADHQPIVLFAEQTIGGYAKIATVISTDLRKIAQAVPGGRVQFEKVDLAAAHAAYLEQKDTLARIAAMWR